ncbi:hypothetical protein PZA11_006527 [Diplocarpon coronariae]
MRSVYPLVALGTWASSVAADLPLVASDVLQRGLLRSALVEKSEALLSLADDNTRLYGTSGHNKTVDWIQSALSAYSNYYDVEVQPFQMPAVVTTFRASATRFVADAMEMSPEGSVSAPLVLVADNGCAAVDFPPEVAGAISPGINDNGSGMIALLEVAQLLTNFSVNHAVRFSWFSAEEQGKRGSYHYLNSLSEEELARIRLFLNFDMIASPNYIYGIYDGDGSSFNVSGAAGSGEAEKLFEDFFAQEGLPFEPIVLRLSDSLPFFEAGIPTGGLFTGATENKTDEQAARFGGQAGVPFDLAYHTALDDVNNLNLTAFLNNAKAIAHTVATYAVSWEGEYGVPKRTKRDLKARVRRPVWKKARKSADT